jgi:2-oxoglutarate dehydrogenase E2 component (dihydrolipoamide succinyltransferase)
LQAGLVASDKQKTPTGQLTSDGQRPPSPLAKRIAAEYNVDLSQVKGSSPHGRVTKDDVIGFMEQHTENTVSSRGAALPSEMSDSHQIVSGGPAKEILANVASVPQAVSRGREERVRLSRRRQTIAQRLVEAQHSAAMLTTFNEIDMSAVMELRSRRKDAFKERHNISLGFMSFFTKAAVGALKAFPRLNAEIQGNEMVLKHYYDIGIAVGAEEGLVVPVLRDADRKSFAEIEQEIATLAKKARENSLALTELQGGTFTISNGGVFGSLLSTPILNAPQVGILGMHKIEQRPVAVNGQVVIRSMMYVALSYDHRIVDGREAVQFLVRIKELVEDPETLLLEG